jgi:hypothetical protein
MRRLSRRPGRRRNGVVAPRRKLEKVKFSSVLYWKRRTAQASPFDNGAASSPPASGGACGRSRPQSICGEQFRRCRQFEHKLQLKNPREEAFARARLTGLSKAAAAIEAGFSPRSAMQIGSQISARPRVQRRMEQLRDVVLRVFDAIDGEPESDRIERLCAHKVHASRRRQSEK